MERLPGSLMAMDGAHFTARCRLPSARQCALTPLRAEQAKWVSTSSFTAKPALHPAGQFMPLRVSRSRSSHLIASFRRKTRVVSNGSRLSSSNICYWSPMPRPYPRQSGLSRYAPFIWYL